jgi:membrane associated rhomboid family serine protease
MRPRTLKVLCRVWYAFKIVVLGVLACVGFLFMVLGAIGAATEAALMGAVFLLLFGAVLIWERKQHKKKMGALDGDLLAAAELREQLARDQKWTWRVNGVMVSAMLVIFTAGVPFAETLPAWQRILFATLSGALLVVCVGTTVRAWRS